MEAEADAAAGARRPFSSQPRAYASSSSSDMAREDTTRDDDTLLMSGAARHMFVVSTTVTMLVRHCHNSGLGHGAVQLRQLQADHRKDESLPKRSLLILSQLVGL
uniref:Uncharacterized protein n=1 Tax=Oryza sativa subsp. japonica TaxID=39947 RepID=Q5Z6E8_ORYSJ|nr:hypothetical protein [Oryza sativa Japonica Group]